MLTPEKECGISLIDIRNHLQDILVGEKSMVLRKKKGRREEKGMKEGLGK